MIEHDAPMWTHTWYWRKWLPERNGQRCRIVAVGKLNAALVEFADGFKVIANRRAVRRIKEAT